MADGRDAGLRNIERDSPGAFHESAIRCYSLVIRFPVLNLIVAAGSPFRGIKRHNKLALQSSDEWDQDRWLPPSPGTPNGNSIIPKPEILYKN